MRRRVRVHEGVFTLIGECLVAFGRLIFVQIQDSSVAVALICVLDSKSYDFGLASKLFATKNARASNLLLINHTSMDVQLQLHLTHLLNV